MLFGQFYFSLIYELLSLQEDSKAYIFSKIGSKVLI